MPQYQITGTENGDYLLDSALNDEILGLGGNDEIKVSSGNDTVYGDAGIDKLIVDYSVYNENLIFSLQNYSNLNYDGLLYVDFLETKNNNSINFYSIEILEIAGGFGFDRIAVNYFDSDEDLHIVSSGGAFGDLNVYHLKSDRSDYLEFSSIEGLNITSGSGDDRLDLDYDEYSNDSVNTGAGDDYISTGKGIDIVDGGIGFDILNLDFGSSESGVTSSLNSSSSGTYTSSDTTVEFSNIEAVEILGSQYNDTLVAFAGNNNLNIDSDVDGGDGSDRLVVDYSDDDGDYELTTHPRSNTLDRFNLSTGDQNTINFNSIESFDLTTGDGDNIILLSIGHIDGASSNDIIDAGAGNDWIYTDKGFDVVDGGSEFDVLSISFVDNTSGVTSSLNSNNSGEYLSETTSVEFDNIEAVNIIGSFYDDVLTAIPYNNSDYSHAHSSPTPKIDGGNGLDRLVVDYSDSVIENSNLGIYIYGSSLLGYNPQTKAVNTISFQSIEAFEITAGNGNNIINLGYDNFSNDTINAGDGDDEITAGKGFDVIDGGNGHDVLTLNFNSSSTAITSALSNIHSGEYSNQNETLRVTFSEVEAVNIVGSSNNDVLYGLEGKDTIYGGLGADRIFGNNEDDFIDGASDQDFLVGGDGNDTIKGGLGIDTIGGGNGNDLIRGEEERDILFGHNGNDTLEGGSGNDILKGGNKDDVLFGGDGRDILFGNAGADIFVLKSSDTRFDIVKDFTDGVDRLGLSDGITFDDLIIRGSSAGTVIKDASNGRKVLASLIGVVSTDITSTDFVSI